MFPMRNFLGAPDEDPFAQLAKAFQGPANTLGGGGVTLGNQEAQQDYARQLAEAMSQMQQAAQQSGLADSLMRPEYAQNSGALGSLAMMAQAFAGKKLAKRAGEDDAAARERYYKGEAALKDAEARKEAERKIAADAAERAQREADADAYGLTGRDRLRYALEGKVGEGVRGVPMMTDQGLVNVNPYTNEYESVRPQGQGAPAGVRIDPSLPPEIQAAIAAHERNGTAIPDELNVTQQAPLRPYEKPPSELDIERVNLARRTADRADAAEARAQEAARRAAAEADRKARQPNAALEQWVEARKGLESGLGRTDTGPIVGRLPAFTTDQQIAEGSVAATAPILKQLFRTAGEGTFTDKDQELLMKMVPTRTDTPEARKAKIENIDRIIRAKLGGSRPANNDDDLIRKYL